MSQFFQSLIASLPANIPVILASGVLLIMIIKLGHKMELGFFNLNYKIDTEINKLRTEMNEGFLKVDHQLKHHDQELKGVKRQLKKHEKLLLKHQKLLLKK
jgi:hypothetical protein